MPQTPFTDRAVTFSYFRILAVTFGVTGLICALTAAGLYLSDHEPWGNALGVLVVPLIGAGAVLRIRAFFASLHNRWEAAFQLGIQVGRQQEQEDRDGGVLPFR